MSNPDKYNGRRYVCLARCSTAEQAETSIPDQIKLLKAFGDQHGMIYVDQITLEGVTGSVPGARTDIDEIIRRKIDRNDFDVLLVQDVSRLTRSGPEHGMKLKYDLGVAGIQVIFAADGIPEGDHASIIESLKHFAANQHVKSLSFATARGMQSSLERGRTAHCLRPPYGIDRLYVSADNKPLHVIRNLPDGTQVQLHPETDETIRTFGVNEKGKPQHYRMQPNERVVLIPGDPERVAIVQHIYRRHMIDGWGGYRIGRELNAMGKRSDSGRSWSVTSINFILANPLYSGRGIANRYTSAVYHKRSKNAPTKVESDCQVLAQRKRPPQHLRPKSEWMDIEHPKLRDYLGDLRQMAVAAHEKKLERLANRRSMKPASKDRHIGSPYILKGILKSKQGGHLMTGRTIGHPDKVRYYAINRGFNIPQNDKLMRRLVRAEELEAAVLHVVRNVLLSASDLRDRLINQIEQYRNTAHTDATDLTKLEAKKAELTRKMEFVIDSLSLIAQEAAKKKLGELDSELTELAKKIDAARSKSPSVEKPVTDIADEIIAKLGLLGQQIDKMPSNALRNLLAGLVSRLEVDLTDKSVEIDLALPHWDGLESMCLVATSACKSVNQAHAPIWLETADCVYSKPCFSCQRRKAA
jgi:DNA invertase Pin-like site-specific DNA recombinase